MRSLVLFVSAAILSSAAHAALFSGFVVFGDSLSDNGNAYIGTGGSTPAPPLYTIKPGGFGRFTDGPDTNPAGTAGGIWHEVLAGLLGEPVAAPFVPPVGGTNYAVGGAQVLHDDTSGPFTIPSLHSQVLLYLSSVGGHADSNALYVLWGGANDLYSAVETAGATAADIANTESQMVGSLATDIGILTAAGARDFLWLNLPQLATTPRGAFDIAAVTPAVGAAFATASTKFAADVFSESMLLQADLGVRIADVNIFALYQAILANPANYGYSNVTGFAQGNPSANPDHYLFWDFPSHPTTPGHALIGQAADEAVIGTFAPEPATWWFATAGLLVLIWNRELMKNP
jgi:outer membrane lipase/esterase